MSLITFSPLLVTEQCLYSIYLLIRYVCYFQDALDKFKVISVTEKQDDENNPWDPNLPPPACSLVPPSASWRWAMTRETLLQPGRSWAMTGDVLLQPGWLD